MLGTRVCVGCDEFTDAALKLLRSGRNTVIVVETVHNIALNHGNYNVSAHASYVAAQDKQ